MTKETAQLEFGAGVFPAAPTSVQMLVEGVNRESIGGGGLLKLMAVTAIGLSHVLTPVRSSLGLFSSQDESAIEMALVESHTARRSQNFLSLAQTAESRMTSERRLLLSKIREIRDSFGETVDTVALIREIRDES